jgi:hypothetical protein
MKPAKQQSLWPFAAALVALKFLAYANSFSGGFVLDNRGLLLNDSRLRDASFENLRLIWSHTYWWPHGESGLYRPFTTLTYLFNYSVLGNGEQPFGYHAVNLLLHAGSVLMAFALAMRLLRRVWPSFFAAALWAVHPLLTEAVTNIVGRSDLLAAAAVLGGLLLYLKSVDATGSRRWLWLFLLAIVTAIGAFSKETAAVLPGAIVLYEFTFLRKWGNAQWLGLAAVAIPIALMLWQRSIVLADTAPMEIPFTDNAIAHADFLTGRLTALGVMMRYFGLIAWPATLSADYSWSQIALSRNWWAAAGALAILAAAVLLYRKQRAAFFFLGLGLLWLAPVSNLLFPTGTIMAERLAYLTALGVTACIAIAAYRLPDRYATALLSVLVLALAARTWMRNADWENDLTIATASVGASPLSFKTHDLLANVLFASDPTHSNLAQAIAESEQSRAILEPLPDSEKPLDPYRFAANLYMLREDYPKAAAALRTLIAAEHTKGIQDASAELTLASALGDAHAALEAAAKAQASNPLDPQIYRVQADADAAAGRLDDAAVALVEGTFITGDKSFRAALIELYRKAMDPRSCALTQGPAGPAINPACPVVHRHVCGAAAYTVQTLRAAGKSDLAQARKQMFVNQFGCPAQP